jgi:MFS family permease
LVLISFVGTFAFVGMESTFALFGEHRFGYDPAEIALLFAYIGLAAAASQGAIVGRLVDRMGESLVLSIGLGGTAVGMALLAVSGPLPLLLLALALIGLASGLVFATISALISLAAGEDEQGGVLGVLASSSGLARIAGPLVATALFQEVGVSSPLALAAILFAACLILATFGAPRPAALRASGEGVVRDV